MPVAQTTKPATKQPQAITFCPICGHDQDLHSPVTGRCVLTVRRWYGDGVDARYIKKACRCGEETGCR